MLARRRTCARGGDRGAAAVEFALVVPILVLLLFGIIDYGLYFANALGVRSGVSEAGRQIIVGNLSDECDGAPAEEGTVSDLVVKIRECVDPIAGTAQVAVNFGAWAPGENVQVCAIIDVEGLTGFLPKPQGGRVGASVVLPIQQGGPPSGEPVLPGWFDDWCINDAG